MSTSHSCGPPPPMKLLWPVLVTLGKAALWDVVLKEAVLFPRDTAVLPWNWTWLSTRLGLSASVAGGAGK